MVKDIGSSMMTSTQTPCLLISIHLMPQNFLSAVESIGSKKLGENTSSHQLKQLLVLVELSRNGLKKNVKKNVMATAVIRAAETNAEKDADAMKICSKWKGHQPTSSLVCCNHPILFVPNLPPVNALNLHAKRYALLAKQWVFVPLDYFQKT